MMVSSSEGADPIDFIQSYRLPMGVRWFRWNGDEHICDVCGRMFENAQTMAVHRISAHFSGSCRYRDSDSDVGFEHLVSAVASLWRSFRYEHPIPRVVPLFGSVYLRNRTRNVVQRSGSYMPVFYRERIRDDVLGTMVDALVLPDMWMRLDPEGKCATLAHAASHIENAVTQCVHDVSFSRGGWHNRSFMRTAASYDLYVSNVPRRGYAMTIINDEFKRRHKDDIRRIAKFHSIVDVGGERVGYCGL